MRFFHTHNRNWIDSRKLQPFSLTTDPNEPKVSIT